MPTRKQRRRRLKERRHEWEEVYVDAEGNEIPPEEAEQLLPEGRAPREKPRDGRRPAGSAAPRGRGGREIQPASWRRVAKRGAIFAPFMFLFIALTSRDTSVAADVFTTVWLLLIFLPFSYLMDSIVHRMAKKREARVREARRQS